MTGERAILLTVTGPGGHADVGVRSDATPRQLAAVLGAVIGLGPGQPAAEHRSPPRPGVPHGGRALLRPDVTLAEAGVADGDLIVFGRAGDAHEAGVPVRAGQREPGPGVARPPGRPALWEAGEQRRSMP